MAWWTGKTGTVIAYAQDFKHDISNSPALRNDERMADTSDELWLLFKFDTGELSWMRESELEKEPFQ